MVFGFFCIKFWEVLTQNKFLENAQWQKMAYDHKNLITEQNDAKSAGA